MLHSDQIQHLEKQFRVTGESPQNLSSIQSVQELLEPETCHRYLQMIAHKFNTSSLVVIASQFAKRYASLLTIPTLYTMSVYNKALLIEPQNCYIYSVDEKDRWAPRLALANWKVTTPDTDRSIWRDRLLQQLFTENLAKMWDVLHECTGVHRNILWENTAVNVYKLYEKSLTPEEECQPHIQADFEYLLYHTNIALFNTTFHPLQKFHRQGEGRITCCFYFLTNKEKKFCKRCPRRQIRSDRSMVTS